MHERPNILFISTHDISPHLGCYSGVWPGAERASTPNLDALASEGMLFEQAFAAAPVCAPSRAAIMTGCYPTAIGTMHMRTKAVPPPEITLFPQYLRAAGYYTTNNWFTDFQVDTPPTVFDDCSPSGHWRNRPTPDTPFFAAFHGMVTHESQIYTPDDVFAAATSNVLPEQRQSPEDVTLPPYYPDTPVFRTAWARYLELISEMDTWVGRLLQELADDGLADNTIVVFWSDHGVGMPRAKRWAHEAGVREPLIVRWPAAIEAGRRADVVELLDLAPTLLTAAGLPVPTHMHGWPLFDGDGNQLPSKGLAFGARDRMNEGHDRVRTVRDERYRYIRNLHPDRSEMPHIDYPDHTSTWMEMRRLVVAEGLQLAQGVRPTLLTPLQRSMTAPTRSPEELYDISADPHETRNLADDPEHAPALERLRAALDDWLERHADLGALPEDELLEAWMPGGVRRKTDAAMITFRAGAVEATCATDGAAIGWTSDPPMSDESAPPSPMGETLGAPVDDGRRWHLYNGPVDDPGEPIWFRCFRIGYEPSTEVEVRGDQVLTAH